MILYDNQLNFLSLLRYWVRKVGVNRKEFKILFR